MLMATTLMRFQHGQTDGTTITIMIAGTDHTIGISVGTADMEAITTAGTLVTVMAMVTDGIILIIMIIGIRHILIGDGVILIMVDTTTITIIIGDMAVGEEIDQMMYIMVQEQVWDQALGRQRQDKQQIALWQATLEQEFHLLREKV